MNTAKQEPNAELDWIKIREEFPEIPIGETIYEKAKRKTQENPFVPLGCLATTMALSMGLFNFYKGNSQMQQYMMRARVGAQAFTIVCIVVGIMTLPKRK